MNRSPLVLALSCALILAACSGGQASVPSAEQAPKPLLLVADDLIRLQPEALSQGPVISGSIQPERRAELRAEVAGVVLDVLKDNGDVVAQGELLLRIDPTAIRDRLLSAEQAERAAVVAAEQGERQFKRMQQLMTQQLISTEMLEGAESRRNQSQSELASARARVVEARQQLQRTEVRAPFAGIVGARSASAGDTAQVGMALLSVVDPASMRFEGLVAAEQVAQVQTGANVRFRVNGHAEQVFEGRVERVNPLANENTRQVQVLVSLDGANAPKVAGLYAEGRVETAQRQALVLPESALQRDGDAVSVWQVKEGSLLRASVEIGERDERSGRFEVRAGLQAGDQVLRHPVGALREGVPVQQDAGEPSLAQHAQRG